MSWILAALLAGFAVQGPPAASPAPRGPDPERLEELARRVEAWIEAKELLGAELLVLHEGRAVLHRAAGRPDTGGGAPLALGALHSCRALGAPLLGTLAQIAIDQGRLGLDEPVGRYLPDWAAVEPPPPTVRHLLTRCSGLGQLPTTAGAGAADLRAVQGGRSAPGGGYVEAEADLALLTALLEAVWKRPLESLLREQVLDPLRTESPAAAAARQVPLHRRVDDRFEPCAPVVDRPWEHASSAEDAARLLALWLDKGRAGSKRVLSRAAVARGLDPVIDTGLSSGLPGLEVRAGQMWRLHVLAERTGSVEAFSSSGSDGSYLWAFPAEELIVVLLTSCEGADRREAFEAALQPLLPARYSSPPQEDLAPLLGIYWDTEEDDFVALLEDAAGLLVELPGVFVLPLRRTPAGWAFPGLPWTASLELDSQGRGKAFVFQGARRARRFERRPLAADLPALHELMEKHTAASGWARLKDLGTWRRRAAIERTGSAGRGAVTTWVQGGRARVDVEVGSAHQTTWVHGPLAWQKNGDEPAAELDPVRAEQAGLEHPAVLLGDWRLAYQEVNVLQRGELAGEPVVVVRAVPHLSFATTYTLSERTGHVVRLQRVVWLTGFGNVGIDVRLGDYRAVSGVTLPFRTVTAYALPELGRTTLQVLAVDVGLDPPAGLFEPPGR